MADGFPDMSGQRVQRLVSRKGVLEDRLERDKSHPCLRTRSRRLSPGGYSFLTGRSPTVTSRSSPTAPLLEDLIGLEEEDGGDGEAKSLRGLEVDDEPKARWLLERQVGRSCPFENAMDEGGHSAEACVQLRA